MGFSYNLYLSYVGHKLDFNFYLKSTLRFIKVKADYKDSLSYSVSVLWGLLQVFPSKANKPKDKPKKKLKKKKDFSLKKIFSEDTRSGIIMLLNIIKPIIRRLKPRIESANLKFSCGEPDVTGMILGGISIIPIIYQDNTIITGDFESDEAYFDGYIKLKGSFSFIALIKIIHDLMKNKLLEKIMSL